MGVGASSNLHETGSADTHVLQAWEEAPFRLDVLEKE